MVLYQLNRFKKKKRLTKGIPKNETNAFNNIYKTDVKVP